LFIRLILLFILIGGAGCSPKFSLLNLKTNTKTVPKETAATVLPKISKTEPEKKKNIDPRLQKIVSTPSLLANKKSIMAARKAVSIVKSQSETQVVASSNVGPSLDDNTVGLDATTGITISKIISDGGVQTALTDAANLNVLTSEITYEQNINKQLAEVIKADQAIVNFQKVKSIYQEQLKVYSENLPLIEAAVKANVISKTDALKLDQLKLRSEERYLNAKTLSETSLLVRQKYNLKDSDKFFEVDIKSWKSFEQKVTKNKFTKIKLIETQIQILEKDIEAIKSTFKANVSFNGNATAKITDIDNSLGFLGLNITLPVKDGGKRNFEVEEKNLQISSLEQQKDEVMLVNKSSFSSLANFEKIYNLRSDLIDAQTGNSKIISEDMELKLKAGAASVVDLATEKMNFYDLVSQKVALEYQKIQEVIKFFQILGHECDLTALCDQVNSLATSK
jgi:outer membrane protein TolC